MKHSIEEIGRGFRIPGTFLSADALKAGHIHDTYVTVYARGRTQLPYTLQRINTNVFKDPELLMHNVERVTSHIRHKLAVNDIPDFTLKVLKVIPARDGAPLYRDPDGNYWRCYRFIDGTVTYDVAEDPTVAFEAARKFGLFTRNLLDLPEPRLAETIPDFHNTPKRFAALEKAIQEDKAGRAASCKAEIDFAMARRDMTRVLLDLHEAGAIPERVTHNDTKINNVLMDEETGKSLCIIDLDTVMPGLVLYDFGDLVRTSVSPAAEDERDLTKVALRMEIFEALVRGYLSTVGEFLTAAEKQHLAFSGRLITFEIGIRFLTDHLEGDVYFKVHRDDHNLDRCRTQFRLVELLERHADAMDGLVRQIAPE
jgi:Ser/Thr protein kinase RdoA (MazF antagonist)